MSWFLRQIYRIVCFYLLLSRTGALELSAQEFRGALRGIVQDASGGRVPAAKIFIHGNEPSLQREIASDSRGEFRIDDLLPGTYGVKVQASGFADANSNVKITVSSVQEITIILKPRPVQQTITLDEDRGSSSITDQLIDAALPTSLTSLLELNRWSLPIRPKHASPQSLQVEAQV